MKCEFPSIIEEEEQEEGWSLIDTWDGRLGHKLNHKLSIDPLEFRSRWA
jgi:hypothetical protein